MKALVKLAMLLVCLQAASVLAATIDGGLGEKPGHSRAAHPCTNTSCMAAHDGFDDGDDDDLDDGDAGPVLGLRADDDDE